MEETAVRPTTSWPPGGGETGARLRAAGGAVAALGPAQDWPAALRIAAGMVLGAELPMALLWGPELLLIYNDAAISCLGPRHPASLGRPLSEAWPEGWGRVEPELQRVLQRGETVAFRDRAFLTDMRGPARERCFSGGFSPVRDEADRVAGVLVTVAETTRQLVAERQARVGEERHHAFVHAAALSVFRLTADGRQLLENAGAVLPAHGAGPGAVAAPIEEVIHPEDRPKVRQAWKAALESGLPYEIEHRAPRPGGGWGWVQARAVPLRDEQGEIVEWVGSATDITARKQAEQALRRSEVVHRIAIEAGGIGTWDMDYATHETAVSPAMGRLMGLPPHLSTVSGAAWHEAIAPEYRAALTATLALAAGRDVPFELEFRIALPDGGERWLFSRGRVTRDAAGRPQRVHGAAVDVTDRRQWEQRVRDSETQFRVLFENTHVGMAQCDPATGRLLRINEQLARMLGSTRGELLGRPFVELTHPEDREGSLAGFERLVRGELPNLDIEKRLLHKEGHPVWVMMNVNVIRDAAGTAQRTATVVMDISARKAAEEALRRAHDELETRVQERTAELAQANAALRAEVAERRATEQRVRALVRQLLGAEEEERRRLSRELHDTLGQHLTVLDLGLKAVTDQNGCPATVHRQLTQVRQAAHALDEAVDRLAHELRPPSLDDLGLEDALRLHVEAWSAESGIPVEFHVHGLRGPRMEAVIETTVYRVVQEALTNVHRHAGAGRVALIVEQRGGELRALVEDDGQGFDTEAVAPRTRRSRLGLRGMQERASLVGGRLEVESTPGFGSTVYLTIPLPPAPEAAEDDPDG